MKVFTSRISLLAFMTLSIAIGAISYFPIILAIDQYARGYFSSVALLALFAAVPLAVGVYFGKSVYVPLKLSHLSILDFLDISVTYRPPEVTQVIDIPYEQIESAVITENLGKYAPSRLVVTLVNGSKISIEPSFNMSKKVVMAHFEHYCSTLKRRYKWQWSKLYRTC